ncbi:MAG: succinate dehydrogenase, cytochrome b556 subunit [Zetaproteobacteria bacterium]|nr:MAG: succinate dehydrogenase, cytochrome b556 subunit [Zetaproteobacteria bacterium]
MAPDDATPARTVTAPHLAIYRWSWPMAASITHRISGLLLALSLPFYLLLLALLGGGPADFQHGLALLHSFGGGLLLWLSGSALCYHLCNGIRFLLLDAGLGEERATMIRVARWPFVATAIGALLLAVVLL